MKKCLVPVLIGVAATAATAQSSVTLFGVVDLSLRTVKNGDVRNTGMAPDGYQTSRFGVRGVEDIGGGLKTIFWFESAVAPDTGNAGAGGKFWNRRSTVGLSGKFGEIHAGRDYSPSYWNLGIFDAFGNFGIGSALNMVSTLGSGAATLVRTDSGFSYFTPSGLGGFYGHVRYAFGEGGVGKYTGARLGYRSGKLDAAVGYGQTDTTAADKFKVANAGISYDFGFVKPLFVYQRAEYGARKQVIMEIGAVVPVGLGEFHVAYASANASGAGTDANDAKLIALNYGYFLSKRTTLYSSVARIRNSGKAAFSVGTRPAGVAGRNSTGFDVGIRHTF